MFLLLSLLLVQSLSAKFEEIYQKSLWKPKDKIVLEETRKALPEKVIMVFEVGMDFGCVCLCREVFEKKTMIQSAGAKRNHGALRRELGDKVSFSRATDSRMLHVGKKPNYGLIIINNPVHRNRFSDLGFAFKHTRFILVTECGDKFAESKKFLKEFLEKNKHVKIINSWVNCGGSVLLQQ